jgi:hypothetical protein
MKKLKLDWDKIVFNSIQIAEGQPEKLIRAFINHHIDSSGQDHSVALFQSIKEKGNTQTFYLTPKSNNRFKPRYLPVACSRPNRDTVKMVACSNESNYEYFWD